MCTYCGRVDQSREEYPSTRCQKSNVNLEIQHRYIELVYIEKARMRGGIGPE